MKEFALTLAIQSQLTFELEHCLYLQWYMNCYGNAQVPVVIRDGLAL